MIISGKKLIFKSIFIFLGLNLFDFLFHLVVLQKSMEFWLIQLGGATLYMKAIISIALGLHFQRKEEIKRQTQDEGSYN